MSESREKAGGILASLRNILDGGLALAETRLELLAVELRQEKCRLVEAMIWASAVVAFGMMTLILLTFVLVVLFWNDGRLAVLLSLGGLYLLATSLAWRGLRRRLDGLTSFSGTLGEIRKDRECLRSKD